MQFNKNDNNNIIITIIRNTDFKLRTYSRDV